MDAGDEEGLKQLDAKRKPVNEKYLLGLYERRVFATNISFKLGEKQVKELFAKCGEIVKFFFARDRKTDKACGYAVITYSRADEA